MTKRRARRIRVQRSRRALADQIPPAIRRKGEPEFEEGTVIEAQDGTALFVRSLGEWVRG